MTQVLTDDQTKALRSVWWLPVLRGVLLLILGILMLFHPLESITALVWIFGIVAIIDGLLIVVGAFTDRRNGGFWWTFLGGLAVIGLGVVFLVWPSPTVTVLFYLVAGWVVILGLIGLVGSIVLHQRDQQSWFLALAFGLVNLVIGLLLFANPQTSVTVIMVLAGLFTLVSGVLLLVGGIAIRSFTRKTVTVS